MRTLDVAVELGPKGRRAAAWAPRWPGLERGGASPDEAVERLVAYRERYAPVARLAGVDSEFARERSIRVVATYPGTGSTDFWGISFAPSPFDEAPLDTADLERSLDLVAAAWRYFDDVRARVSPSLRKGPRGGGREREEIARHVLSCEQDWARKVGVTPVGDLHLDPASLARHRTEYRRAVIDHHVGGRRARTWTLPFLVRHSAFHVLDHAWEMEDRDLTVGAAGPASDR